jgi:CoA:oxalate CoA-transferase
MDLKNPRALELVKAMLPKFDVVVENFAPGVINRLGLGYDVIKQINPKVIMCSISVCGQTGPLRNKPGYDYIGQAYAGITDQIGEPDRAPSQLTMAAGDISTGVAAAMAVGFALLHRERTGEGQYLDASITDTYFHWHHEFLPKVSLRGPAAVPKRNGSQHPGGGPAGIFRYGDDQYLYVTVLPHQWPQFVKAIGMPELATDPRFRNAHTRRDNNDALKQILEEWLSKFPTREAALAALEKERVPCAPVLSLYESANHPHMRERKTARRVKDRLIGEFDIPGMPVKFSSWPDRTDVKADLLGESNEAVLREYLNLSDADIAQLYKDKVLVHDRMLDGEATQK